MQHSSIHSTWGRIQDVIIDGEEGKKFVISDSNDIFPHFLYSKFPFKTTLENFEIRALLFGQKNI